MQVRKPEISLVEKLRNSDGSVNMDLFKLDNQAFVDFMLKSIPEAAYLNTKANVSAEKQGDAKPAINLHGLTEPEAVRAFLGLLTFKEVMTNTIEDYNELIKCQIELKKPVLTKKSFDQMLEFNKKILKTPEDYAAAMWSILCNDLGKVHLVIDEYKKKCGDNLIGHDGLLAQILKNSPEMFPGFAMLPEEYRQHIIAGYASGCDISMLEQLELPMIALIALRKLDKAALDHYILHTIYDVAGAAGGFRQNGSLTMTEETWTFFYRLYQILQQIHDKTIPLEKIYDDYLTFRGECVGIKKEGPESIALMRIAGLARLATPKHGELLKGAWNKLTPEERATLIKELNISGGSGVRPIFIGYGVAMLVNPMVALKSVHGTVVNEEGLTIGLKYMAEAFRSARSVVGRDAAQDSKVFVAECDTIASALNKNPREFVDGDKLTRAFQINAQSNRRVDFSLVLPGMVKTLVPIANMFGRAASKSEEVVKMELSTTKSQETAKMELAAPKL